MTGRFIPIELLISIIIIAGAMVILGLTRRYKRNLGTKEEKRAKSENVNFIINTFSDLTKQLKDKEKELERLKALAEQRAENVESYNENILQCVTSGVLTFDRDRRLTTINRAAVELLGLGREQVQGRDVGDLFGEGEIARAVAGTMETKQPSARLEAVYRRQVEQLWLGFNTAVLTDRRGEALGVILSFSDLTEVKRLQEQVELRERLTALGEMSAGIAHELRNPMGVISGYLNLLAKKVDATDQETIRSISSEISGMNRIIGDLLTFARPASLNRVRSDLRELLEGCMTTALKASGADKHLETVMHVGDIDAVIDETLMRQAFTNLIQNAVEAIQDRGTISITATKSNRDLVVEVGDTGAGIPPDRIKKIFLPFFTTKDRGVGMGLALAHKIVASHGGRIEVASREGRGTTFSVIIPERRS